MENIVELLDSSLIQVKEVMAYLENFKNYVVLKKDKNRILLDFGYETLFLCFLDIGYAKWWSIGRYHKNGVKYEQVDVFLYQKIKKCGINRIIEYSSHIEDQENSSITCSSYSCLDSDVKISFTSKRTIPLEKLKYVQYAPDMNLNELVLMVDKCCEGGIKSEDVSNEKSLVLKLEKI